VGNRESVNRSACRWLTKSSGELQTLFSEAALPLLLPPPLRLLLLPLLLPPLLLHLSLLLLPLQLKPLSVRVLLGRLVLALVPPLQVLLPLVPLLLLPWPLSVHLDYLVQGHLP